MMLSVLHSRDHIQFIHNKANSTLKFISRLSLDLLSFDVQTVFTWLSFDPSWNAVLPNSYLISKG